MKTLNLKIPVGPDVNERDVMEFLAAKLYESGRLTLGQAAEMAGMRTVDFADILSKYEVSLFNYPPSDIKRDAANA